MNRYERYLYLVDAEFWHKLEMEHSTKNCDYSAGFCDEAMWRCLLRWASGIGF